MFPDPAGLVAPKAATTVKNRTMTIVHRVLPPQPYASFDEYLGRGGGRGWETARTLSAEAIIAEVEAAGLRGRGGAGFPTGRKWRTVASYASPVVSSTVVVNAAEGEPGTFKDRTIVRANPYEVIDGALIAARAVGAASVVVATKRAFTREVARLREAIAEMAAAGWLDGIDVEVFEGPEEYLYGEETALLETADGRHPFPRIAPPFRRGVVEVVESDSDAVSGSGLSAHVEMAGPGDEALAPPTLVDNVETLANVPKIIARGAAWFRTEGTDESPGTIVCTVTGATRRDGVGEVMMGTTIRDAIELIGGGPRDGHEIKAVLGGVSSAIISADLLDTPMTYEDLAELGSGLGSAGFVVLDDTADLAALAAGVSRFLAVESCGQCTPCKQDGLVIADRLAALCRGEATALDLETVAHRVDTIATGARCSLAGQHQSVIGSILATFGDELRAHLDPAADPVEPILVAELADIVDGQAEVSSAFAGKQPDWTHDARWSGRAPVERFADHRRGETSSLQDRSR